MIKELRIAIEKGQMVSVKTKDGEVVTGTPEAASTPGKVKIRNELGVTYIPFEEIDHVMRVITFP
ncbi:formylmethanofuran dehydrogenase subunit D [Paenibacillus forsythiae]|uniref:Formylmethanofuran dehydrogenase subunit D n=1 Tax=Paenibacillus forsythiae TaxID=365616 RepID=A0ABU3H5R7_9BACL|nr:hypothetical protein [Paenibacillus forsythiae]MDT3426051.1 formylmethanofuran dehydrogenase subunit D [Paenibacillus forsythiae]